MNQLFCSMEGCLRPCEYTVRFAGKEGYGRIISVCMKHTKSLVKALTKGERLEMSTIDSSKEDEYPCEARVPSNRCPNPALFEYITMREHGSQITTTRHVPTKLCRDHLTKLVPVVPFGYIAQVRRLPLTTGEYRPTIPA